MHMHHARSQAENPVIVSEEPEEQFEVQPQEVPKADEEDIEELQECLDHRPSFFERGKPRSISPSVCKYLINALL
jgi:DNA-directed RNA polymerase specialized sigma24 family protein